MTFIKNRNIFLFFITVLLCLPFFASASTTNGTIDSIYKYAWSNNIGWINFGPIGANSAYQGLVVTDSTITGYAWSESYGWINFGPFVNNTGGGVKNTTGGILSGYAWGQYLGWINFSGVSINSSGQFVGKAMGSNVGIINFDLTKCTNCGVRTDWRPTNVVVSGGGGGNSGIVGIGNTPLPPPQVIPPPVSVVPPNKPPVSTTPTQPPESTNENPTSPPPTGQNASNPASSPISISGGVKTGKISNLIQKIINWFMEIIKWFWLFLVSLYFSVKSAIIR